jgi:hypothetical protein
MSEREGKGRVRGFGDEDKKMLMRATHFKAPMKNSY